jgi:class 3 adenylate cyclase
MIKAVELMGWEAQTKLAIRIGLHAGPLIAGVIGSSRLTYDFWGETVNLASRLESTGAPGRIAVSGAVAERLKGSFTFEPRGEMELKGFGATLTLYLVGEA